MPDALSRLLATRDWLLADGATGTTLFVLGMMVTAFAMRTLATGG